MATLPNLAAKIAARKAKQAKRKPGSGPLTGIIYDVAAQHVRSTRAQRNDAHRQRLDERRERQRTRAPGFTPVRNNRIASAVQSNAMLLQLAGRPAVDAQAEAWRIVAKRLPAEPRVNRHRVKPSKSDSPEYRKAL